MDTHTLMNIDLKDYVKSRIEKSIGSVVYQIRKLGPDLTTQEFCRKLCKHLLITLQHCSTIFLQYSHPTYAEAHHVLVNCKLISQFQLL